MSSQQSLPVHRFYGIGFHCSQTKAKADILLGKPDYKESKMLREMKGYLNKGSIPHPLQLNLKGPMNKQLG